MIRTILYWDLYWSPLFRETRNFRGWPAVVRHSTPLRSQGRFGQVGPQSFVNWVAVKELNVSYYTGETISIHIYIYINPFMLQRGPAEHTLGSLEKVFSLNRANMNTKIL